MFFGAKQAFANNCLIKVKCLTLKCHLLCLYYLQSVDTANMYSSIISAAWGGGSVMVEIFTLLLDNPYSQLYNLLTFLFYLDVLLLSQCSDWQRSTDD